VLIDQITHIKTIAQLPLLGGAKVRRFIEENFFGLTEFNLAQLTG
jgi:hypothetical protein